MRIIVSLITLWILVFSTGCQANPADAETPSENISSPVAVHTQLDNTQMPPLLPTPSNPSLQNLVEKAKEDLAQRLTISIAQINLVEATEVEWSDSSLGCPQPGMDYLQVITPGYLILLDVGGQTYEYHSNRDTYFVLCENSHSPNVPKP